MFSLSKRQAAILLGVVLMIVLAGWLLYLHNADREAKLQQAVVLTEQQAKNINYLQNELNLSRQNAELLAAAVKQAEEGKVQPVVHFTVQASTVLAAAEDVAKRINDNDPVLPPAALADSDRTAVAPRKLTDEQKAAAKAENEKRAGSNQPLFNEEFGVGVYKFNAYRNWEWSVGYGWHDGDRYVPVELQRNYSKDRAVSAEVHIKNAGKVAGGEFKYVIKTDRLFFLF